MSLLFTIMLSARLVFVLLYRLFECRRTFLYCYLIILFFLLLLSGDTTVTEQLLSVLCYLTAGMQVRDGASLKTALFIPYVFSLTLTTWQWLTLPSL